MSMKKRVVLILCILLLIPVLLLHAAATQTWEGDAREVMNISNVQNSMTFDCKSVVLMEANTGTVLYAQNPDEALPPASVTKIMTLLLVMEAIDSGSVRMEDPVTVSSYAASMGGSQVFLKEGEVLCVKDLLKSVVIASANDAAVALAEHICGSTATFVAKMNDRAAHLGMKNTTFENVTGLDDTAQGHLTSAMDIALMSRELIKHKQILEFSSIWMDTIRDGAFGLTNTNRLVRFYRGCTGLKTGSTSKAGFCVSATAERDGLSLICVIMGASASDRRNAIAAQVLDWGFANYAVCEVKGKDMGSLRVVGGDQSFCKIGSVDFTCVIPKAALSGVTATVNLPASVQAEVKEGDIVGEIVFTVDGKVIGNADILSCEGVERIGFGDVFFRMLAKFLMI